MIIIPLYRKLNGLSKQDVLCKEYNIPINTTCHFEERNDGKSVYALVYA